MTIIKYFNIIHYSKQVKFENNNMDFDFTQISELTRFKSAMSGVYLYYELATPVEIDISTMLTDDNFIEVESNGTLTFENTNKNAIPSHMAYLVKVR